jgi:hypothetical protein
VQYLTNCLPNVIIIDIFGDGDLCNGLAIVKMHHKFTLAKITALSQRIVSTCSWLLGGTTTAGLKIKIK